MGSNWLPLSSENRGGKIVAKDGSIRLSQNCRDGWEGRMDM